MSRQSIDRIDAKFQFGGVEFDISKLNKGKNVILGDSGKGKTLIYKYLEAKSFEDKSIVCINSKVHAYEGYSEGYILNIISKIGLLIVIDNADVILSPKIKEAISLDNNNDYIIIGRNTEGLYMPIYGFKTIRSNGSKVALKNLI